jgi:mannose/fructose/N-acetylgalactosamine-specific phosphotransferase system component IIC
VKRLATLMLALAFLGTTVAVAFAQDPPKTEKKAPKKGKKKDHKDDEKK